jgi:hypothetical protein
MTSAPLWEGTMYSEAAWSQAIALELDDAGRVAWTVSYTGNFGNQGACDGIIANVAIDAGAAVFCGQACRTVGGVGLLSCSGDALLSGGGHMLTVISNMPGGLDGFTITEAQLDLIRLP